MTLAPDPDVSHAAAPPAPQQHPGLWRGARRALAARWDILAVISAGGALGSLARWGMAVALPHPPGAFPWATFAVNLAGCLLIGALIVMITQVWPPSRYVRPFLGVGVLGGFTTFSTYMLDTRDLLMTGHAGLAGLYLAGTLAGGLAAVWAGRALARLAVRGARHRALRAADAGGASPPAGGSRGPGGHAPHGPDHGVSQPSRRSGS